MGAGCRAGTSRARRTTSDPPERLVNLKLAAATNGDALLEEAMAMAEEEGLF